MNKKELKKAFKKEEYQKFYENLPMDANIFIKLFDYLSENTNNNYCKGDFKFTKEFLNDKNIDIEKVLNWLIENGGGCDCEILFNIKEKFD